MSTSPLPDRWTTRDLPVLLAAAELLDETGRSTDEGAIVKRLGMERDDVIRALRNLSQRYLDLKISEAWGGAVAFVHIASITEDGLRATGQWPSAEAAADRFLSALDEIIDATPADAPKASRLRAVRDGVVGIGRDVLVDVMGGVLTGRIG